MTRKVKGAVSSVFCPESLQKLLGEDTPFAIREAYNYFRAKLTFAGKGEKCPVFVFTSANAGDGKTLTTINAAISFAALKKRTLIIDADQRNPSVHRYLQVKNARGLSEYLAGIIETPEILDTGVDCLRFLPAGMIPPNPAELLGLPRLVELLAALREEYDFIFVDTPPIGLVSDAVAFTSVCTGYVLVVQSGVTNIAELREAVNDIRGVSGTVAGVVLNDISGKTHFGAGSKEYRRNVYYYRYGNEESSGGNDAVSRNG